jgi:peroxiredoxin Q/BCP
MKGVQFFGFVLGAVMSLALAPGEQAPLFTAKNQSGQVVRLSDFSKKFVLLYFYPKDDTPGCTREACSFRDEYSKLREMNTVIFGVSRQDEKSHQAFRTKHKLPFDLLVDADGSLAESFGVGKIPVIGLEKRQSILIGPDGKVIRFFENVDPATHVHEVMQEVEKASTGMK